MPRRRHTIRLVCTALERRDVPATFNVGPGNTAGLVAAFNAANDELKKRPPGNGINQTIDRTTPPSTRKAAPFVAAARGLHT